MGGCGCSGGWLAFGSVMIGSIFWMAREGFALRQNVGHVIRYKNSDYAFISYKIFLLNISSQELKWKGLHGSLDFMISRSLSCIARLSFCESKVIAGASCLTSGNSPSQSPLTEFVSTCSCLRWVELELGPAFFHQWSEKIISLRFVVGI